MNTDQQIKELHALYCSLSHQAVGLRYNRESSWIEFIRSGFTKADLELVIQHLLRQVELGERRLECLKFSNVIEGLDRFEEELALIRSKGSTVKVGEKSMTVMDLNRVLQAKLEECEQLKSFYSQEDTFGTFWWDDEVRKKYHQLRNEARELRNRIARMA